MKPTLIIRVMKSNLSAAQQHLSTELVTQFFLRRKFFVLVSLLLAARLMMMTISTRALSVQQVAAAAAAQPLDWAASNFTSYIADRDSNLTWPAASQRQSESTDKVAKNLSVTLQSPLELAFFENDPGEEEEDDDDQLDAEEEEEALATLLDGKRTSEDYAEQPADYEDEDEFYTTNPVETIDWKLKSDYAARPRYAMTRTKEQLSVRKLPDKAAHDQRKNFSDFDDLEALRLKTFYNSEAEEPSQVASHKTGRRQRPTGSGPRAQASKRVLKNRKSSSRPPVRRKKKKKKKKRMKARSGRGEPMSPKVAAESYQSAGRVATGCAFATQTGACVTYDSVEWALRQARRLIGFARPEGLNSLEPSESTIHAVGELTEWTSRLLTVRYGLSGDELSLGLEQVDMSRTSLWRTCPRLFRSPVARQCYTSLQGTTTTTTRIYNSQRAILLSGRYRTHTGQCNNPLVPNYGSSFMPFVRLNVPEYGDGLGSIRMASGSGRQLPPARLVSLALHPSFDVPSSDHSAMFAAWGQLINHDLALASGARVATGHDGSCCSRLARANANNLRLSDPLNRVCMPIFIGPGDPVYGPHGVRCHDFKRSIAGLRPGCSLGPRTQLNLVTSFVDASFVYGSTRSTGAALRSSNRRGQLAVWYYFGARRQPLLPPQLAAPDDECLGRRAGLYCFRSGDSRTNQQVPLVALHTIHARQHNRLARALGALNAHWSSERVYAEARHIHIAQVQHILLTEYLPELLGPHSMGKFELEETEAGGHWDHYNPSLNPGISQEFAAAAFRQGHSSVPGQVFRLDPLTRAPRRAYPLRSLFRQPWSLFEPGAMDEFLAGLVDTPAQGLDPFVSLELTGHLLEEPDEPVGLDLIAINIQRGRDQGVASYNSMREWCGLARIVDFGDLAREVGNQSAQLMASLYESVDDIDLYSGGLSETPLAGAQLGPTFACIVGHQFGLLRRADRHWFESSQGPHAFSSAQLASIKQVPLARLVCANSDRLHAMQPLAMRLPHPIYNPMVACNELPDLDLSLWFEAPPANLVPTQGDPDDDDD